MPGISSSLGAPALAGMAVTERGISAQVTILSGHRVDTDNDWSTLARLDGTLVVLMAATTGRPSPPRAARGAPRRDLPAAVVVDASGPRQAVWHTDLATLAARRRAAAGPCVLVIGAVAAAAPPSPSSPPSPPV